MTRCGGCTLCCKLLNVPGISVQGIQCSHATTGCGIYSDRPSVCKSFNCLWLTSSILGKDESLRPDKCGVMFDLYQTEKTVIAISESDDNITNVKPLIQKMLSDKYIVWVIVNNARTLLLPEGISEETALDMAKKAWKNRL